MKDEPLVSIVVPCYNHEDYVQECLQSIIDQVYHNIELIVIDDGSKDSSVKRIQEMVPACQQRFKRFEFRNRSNKGLCATLNEALEWCEGEFLGCVASDDVLFPYKTDIQVNYLQRNSGTVGVFGGVELLDMSTGLKKKKLRKSKQFRFNDIFLHKHYLPAPTQLLRTGSVKKVGGYRSDLIIEDWSTWLFITEKGGTLDYVSQVFSLYRRHDGNLSSAHDKMHNGRMQILNHYRSVKNHDSAEARVYLVHAHGLQVDSKIEAARWAFEAFLKYPKCILSRSFIWLMLKMFK